MAVDPTFATNDMVCGGEYLLTKFEDTATSFLYFMDSTNNIIPWRLQFSEMGSIDGVAFSGTGKNVAAVGFTSDYSKMFLIYVHDAASQK
jgi:hypothetical protein